MTTGVMEQFIVALNRHSDVMEKFVAREAGAAGAATKPAGTAGKPAGKTTTKPTGPTLETIQERFGAYMSITDKAVRAERKQHVLNIAGKFGADRATAVAPKHFEEALDLLDQYEEGKDPFAEDSGDGDDEGASPI